MTQVQQQIAFYACSGNIDPCDLLERLKSLLDSYVVGATAQKAAGGFDPVVQARKLSPSEPAYSR